MTIPTNNGVISVVVHGATGRMGAETVRAVAAADDVTLVGATCHTPRATRCPRRPARFPCPPTWLPCWTPRSRR